MQDLNQNPDLPYRDEQFDFATIALGVELLKDPSALFNEMHRVLKPGGVAIVSFISRCDFNKGISMWVEDMRDGPGHAKIVGNYFYFNPTSGWRDITSVDITPNRYESKG